MKRHSRIEYKLLQIRERLTEIEDENDVIWRNLLIIVGNSIHLNYISII